MLRQWSGILSTAPRAHSGRPEQQAVSAGEASDCQEVLNACGGPKDNMKFITGTGGEPIPEGVERNKVVVERSIPLEKGMKDCLMH